MWLYCMCNIIGSQISDKRPARLKKTFIQIVAGAIFTEDQKDSPSELAFKYAIYKINKDKTLLANTTLVYDIQYVPKDDSFRTSKKGKNIINY